MNDKVKGTSLALTAAFLWGIMGIFVRNLYLSGYSSFDISFFRCFIAGCAYLVINAVLNPSILKIDGKGLFICFGYGILAYGISFISYNIAVENIPVGVAIVLMFMSPIWVSLIGKFVFKDRLGKFKGIMIGICFFGAALSANLVGGMGGSLNIIGVLAGVINGFGLSLQIMIPRYFQEKYHCDAMLTYGFLGAALVLSFNVDFAFCWESFTVTGGSSSLLNLLAISLLCTLVANVAYVKAPKYIGTMSTSMLAAVEIIIGVIAGYVMFGEILVLWQWVGIAIIIGAVTAFPLER